ncbi:MAG TPA: LysM peptidoglycan-binding domain-containing protein [bacterium]|jgi:nucleoid-associated protein YgaU|nr:LysM peptidoglycan-binding domain-containing protein [bacterium]
MKIKPIILGGLAVAFAGVGCAHKGQVTPDATPEPAAASAPTPQPEDTPKAETKVSPRPTYLVRKGDSLWSIAAKSSVLGDPFRWPILFKQNRDQIQDPDIIEVAQNLDYSQPMDSQAINDAIQKAKDTPAYVAHSEVRKTLPLSY